MTEISSRITTTESIWSIIDTIGVIEFGFVAQALLGIIFFRLGGKIISIKNTGHPDILLYYETKKWRIEVEVIGRDRNEHVIKSDDLSATKAMQSNETGFLAILDINIPARWYMLRTEEIYNVGEKRYKLFELRMRSDKNLSKECSQELYKIIAEHKDTILKEGYSGLVKIIRQQNNEILFED
ncbi:MAG TPA: hypothetical protein VN368_02620 [Candidatus Methylomirabilis sp.]|nr:hypothetical protein [Candidatus Methylomirabilis sp.]